MIKKAYAKLNLFLNVKDKRDDGFHNLEMINIMINLADELEFIPTDGEVKVVVPSEIGPSIEDKSKSES